MKSADVEKGVGELAQALMLMSQQQQQQRQGGGDQDKDQDQDLGVKLSAVIHSLSSSLGAPLCQQLEKSVLGVLHDTPPSETPTSNPTTSSSSSSDVCSSQDKLEVLE